MILLNYFPRYSESAKHQAVSLAFNLPSFLAFVKMKFPRRLAFQITCEAVLGNWLESGESFYLRATGGVTGLGPYFAHVLC